MELDPSNEAHVVAIHEAAHALAIERTGATVVRLWIRSYADDGWEGDTGHDGRGALSDVHAAELDRLTYLAGPLAEEKFTGSMNFDECTWDLAMVSSITEQLPESSESLDDATTRVRSLLDHPPSWNLVVDLASAVLELPQGVSLPHDEVVSMASALLAPRPAPGWVIPSAS